MTLLVIAIAVAGLAGQASAFYHPTAGRVEISPMGTALKLTLRNVRLNVTNAAPATKADLEQAYGGFNRASAIVEVDARGIQDIQAI